MGGSNGQEEVRTGERTFPYNGPRCNDVFGRCPFPALIKAFSVGHGDTDANLQRFVGANDPGCYVASMALAVTGNNVLPRRFQSAWGLRWPKITTPSPDTTGGARFNRSASCARRVKPQPKVSRFFELCRSCSV